MRDGNYTRRLEAHGVFPNRGGAREGPHGRNLTRVEPAVMRLAPALLLTQAVSDAGNPPPPPDAEAVDQLLKIADLLHSNETVLGPFERQQLQRGQTETQRSLNRAWDSRPNLLLFLPDEWRYDWDTFHDGVPLQMPVFRELAARGTRFSHAVVPSPLCAPSRGALAAGKEYDAAHMNGNKDGDYPTNQTTWYRLLRDVGGYHTLTTGKDDLTKTSKLGALATPPGAYLLRIIWPLLCPVFGYKSGLFWASCTENIGQLYWNSQRRRTASSTSGS